MDDEYFIDILTDGSQRDVDWLLKKERKDGRHPDKVSGRQRHHDHPDTLHHQGDRRRAGRHPWGSLATDRDSRDRRGHGEAV